MSTVTNYWTNSNLKRPVIGTMSGLEARVTSLEASLDGDGPSPIDDGGMHSFSSAPSTSPTLTNVSVAVAATLVGKWSTMLAT